MNLCDFTEFFTCVILFFRGKDNHVLVKISNMKPAMFMLANYQIHIFGQNGAYALKFVEEAIEKDILCVAILEEKEHL